MTTTAELFYMAWWCFVICVKLNRTAVDAPVYVVLSTMNSCYECFVYLSAAPPSYPSEVRVFSGSESATITLRLLLIAGTNFSEFSGDQKNR